MVRIVKDCDSLRAWNELEREQATQSSPQGAGAAACGATWLRMGLMAVLYSSTYRVPCRKQGGA